MAELVDMLEANAAEEDAGFSAQTMEYTGDYELPHLGNESQIRYERAVALPIDDGNRIKRRKSGSGYVHETLAGNGWTIQAEFESLDEVLSSPVYAQWKRANPDNSFESRDEPETGSDNG
jgi:hypothetical protein